MRQRDIRLLILILVVAAVAAWVAWPTNPGIRLRLGDTRIERDIRVHLGLDLRGGMQVLLEADVPESQAVNADAMAAARSIVENRVNGLGVTEPIVQAVGTRRVLVELPGIEDPEAAVATLKQTGLMEWVDTGSVYLEPGTTVQTDFGRSAEATAEVTPTQTIYKTILTGSNLKSANVEFDQSGFPVIAFELDAEGGKIFADHTARNVDKYLAIVLDKAVISCPRINSAIPDGRGQIQGQFTTAEAKAMVLQLRYGSLPIPLKIVDTRAVGPTLGAESVDKSVRAGIIGLVIVLLFMLVYYRLPGLLADVALVIYAVITLAIFKLVPVTLTLPGIAGFLLSVGMAVDANILIFERMREELRQGRTLQRAIESGFQRAWTSIFDSNVSTWITCVILWLFGNSFGASMVKGFAVTLAIGVAVSMFTAVTVTRTFIHGAFSLTGEKLREKHWLLGI
ncbi:MAG: protein translocase subunit SecD [Chloroflexota bacterium]